LDFGPISFGGLLDQAAGPFMDTAAIIANLDLVISVDTSITHLAGAMAAPTWLALNYASDWRWLLDREDSPWYPTLRIFRQRRLGDWPGVFHEMAAELERLVANAPRRPLLVEMEPAELTDHIGRLEAELATADSHRAHRLRATIARLRSSIPSV
jgi:hypothetical protein